MITYIVLKQKFLEGFEPLIVYVILLDILIVGSLILSIYELLK